MKEIKFIGNLSDYQGSKNFEISTTKIRGKAKVWLEYCLSNSTEIGSIEAVYVGEKYGKSLWRFNDPLPPRCSCIIYAQDEKIQVQYGVIHKNENSLIYTGEFSDYSIDIISMSLTYSCNLQCHMCWQANYKKMNKIQEGHMPYEDFLKALDRVSFLAPSKVFLWGGEPLLHPNIGEIIRAVKSRKFSCNLITNGMLLEEKTDEILKEKLDTICISLDGVGEIHDSIRGVSGSYEKITRGLEYLIKKKTFRPIVSINMVINERNYLHLYDAVKEFTTFGVNGIQIQFPIYFDMETGMSSKNFIKEKLNKDINRWKGFVSDGNGIDSGKLNQHLQQIKRDFNNVWLYPQDIPPNNWFGIRSDRREINCQTPWKRLNIEPNGDVNICNDHGDMVAGNIIKTNLEEIWNNQFFRTFRREVLASNFMKMCQYCTYSYL